MSDYVSPAADAVVFVFKGGNYIPPQPDEADFVFGADAGEGTDAGVLQSNFMILLTL